MVVACSRENAPNVNVRENNKPINVRENNKPINVRSTDDAPTSRRSAK